MRRSRQNKIRKWLKDLRSDDLGEVLEAGLELNRSDRVPLQPLIAALMGLPNPQNREFAAYALIAPLQKLESKLSRRRRGRAFARRVYKNDYHEKIERIIKVLLKVIDFEATGNVRGQALETLAMSRTAEMRYHRLRRRVEKTVIAALSDNLPEVRFWACYAAGRLKITKALPMLGELAGTDPEDWGQWWPVSEEAADALEWIHGRFTEPRIPFRQRG